MPPTAFGPFRIALIGDFSGRANRGVVETGRALSQRKPVRVDRDSLDDAIARLAPTLRSNDTEITFASLDDFHPDRLYQRLPRLRALRDAGTRDAIVPSLIESRSSSTTSTPTPSDALAAILGDTPLPPGGAAATAAQATVRPTQSDDIFAEFVRRALTPHLVATPNPSAAAIEASVDAAIAAELRSLLHDPAFQALESVWRSVDFLLRRLDTDGTLQVHLVDISREELAGDLNAPSIDESGAYRLLVEGSVGTPGSEPWALLGGLFTLGSDASDFALAERLGLLARHAGAAFVAGGSSALAGTASFATSADPDDWNDAIPPKWDELRASAVAPSVALALPRLLLRLPYGKDTDECELVKLEEREPDTELAYEKYLWGPGSVAAVLAIGEGFSAHGWSLRPSREISGLPLHVYKAGGEALATPCAEVVLTERAAERLLDAGLSPLLSVRDTDEVILPRLQSIARPLTRLNGRWTTASHGGDR